MKKNKTKVLVLLDLNATNLEELLNYTAKISEHIDTECEFFTVKKPTEIIDTDSQLSAMRSINRNSVVVHNKIKSIIEPLTDVLDTNIKTSFAFGNVKTEIKNRVNQVNPDIIILGKREPKVFNLIGDNITDFLLYNCNAKVLIASNENKLGLTSLPSNINLNKEEAFVLD